MSALLFVVVSAWGQAEDALPEIPVDRQEQLAFFKERAAELALNHVPAVKDPLPLKAEPVLRYSNAEREIGSLDGATFLWIEGERPIAAVSFSIRRQRVEAYRECTTFIDRPLTLQDAGGAAWTPKTGSGGLNREVPDAPSPAEGKPQRLTQMRSLARRFSATCYSPRVDEPTQLRLLPQPLYRYADDDSGVLDGGLFAFVVSNDPELFLLVEAVRKTKDAKPQWQYSLARMSSQKLAVVLDDKEVWTAGNFWEMPSTERRTGPYVEGRIGKFEAATP